MNGRQIKDALLERYLAQDLGDADKSRIEKALQDSPADRARLDELRADSQAFLTMHPPGPLVARFESSRQRRRLWLLPAFAAPLVAAAAMMLLRVAPPAQDDFAAKGGVSLVVYLKQGERSLRLESGAAVAPGASLRFEVRAGGPGFAAVLSRDPVGEVSAYYPFGSEWAELYDPASPLLPGAVELDASKGQERLVAIVAGGRFRLAPVLEALKTGGSLQQALPSGAQVVELVLTKK